MKPIVKLQAVNYITKRATVVELLEELQNHHIAAVMEGSKNLDEYSQSQAAELVYRAMRVGLMNGINRPNIQYMISKLQAAIEYLEQLE
jgi:uncharacterized protein YunC (DUF1805 family)